MQQNNNWNLSKWYSRSVFPVGISMFSMSLFSLIMEENPDGMAAVLLFAGLACSVVAQVKTASNIERNVVASGFQKTMYVICIILIGLFSLGLLKGILDA